MSKIEPEDLEICPNCGAIWHDANNPHLSHLVIVEYARDIPEHFDGFSEYMCVKCRLRIGRWSRETIPEGFVESYQGKRGIVPIQPDSKSS